MIDSDSDEPFPGKSSKFVVLLLILHFSEETKGEVHATVSNSTEDEIILEVEPIKMVRQTELRERHLRVEAGMNLQFGVQFEQGKAKMECYDSPGHQVNLSPHGVWTKTFPRKSLKPWRSATAAMVENLIKIRVFYVVSIS